MSQLIFNRLNLPLPTNRFRRQLSEPCHSFPSPPTMACDGRPIYHRQLSEPSIPFPPQGFKQEFPDPLFEHQAMMGAPLPHAYPPSMMIKQEPRDFTYDSGEDEELARFSLGRGETWREGLGDFIEFAHYY